MRSTRLSSASVLRLTFAPRFVTVSPLYTPISDGKDDNIYVTRSYDATSHFETVVDDVHDVWKRVIGKDLVLKKREVEIAQ
jgi:Rab GDP dissociation inhibitor